MRDISLHILDLCQNSLTAGAGRIEILVEERTAEDRLTVRVSDDGRGMSPEQLKSAGDPFSTTRTTRPVGLGLPFFRMAAELTGGRFAISSQPGKGTAVRADFVRSHVDCLPLGDMAATLTVLVAGSPGVDFRYIRIRDDRRFEVDTRQMRGILGNVPLDAPEVIEWIGGCVRSGEAGAAGREEREEPT